MAYHEFDEMNSINEKKESRKGHRSKKIFDDSIKNDWRE